MVPVKGPLFGLGSPIFGNSQVADERTKRMELKAASRLRIIGHRSLKGSLKESIRVL